ncbi:uncharacterized protein IWZ02DRAFT_17639 [Phyllosticta citriasiana]|uniref:uncharacterized protein n=1 Tax=Phyllosticta citriasiana TaxID=595635 RepID=UPI0030FD7EA9
MRYRGLAIINSHQNNPLHTPNPLKHRHSPLPILNPLTIALTHTTRIPPTRLPLSPQKRHRPLPQPLPLLHPAHRTPLPQQPHRTPNPLDAIKIKPLRPITLTIRTTVPTKRHARQNRRDRVDRLDQLADDDGEQQSRVRVQRGEARVLVDPGLRDCCRIRRRHRPVAVGRDLQCVFDVVFVDERGLRRRRRRRRRRGGRRFCGRKGGHGDVFGADEERVVWRVRVFGPRVECEVEAWFVAWHLLCVVNFGVGVRVLTCNSVVGAR